MNPTDNQTNDPTVPINPINPAEPINPVEPVIEDVSKSTKSYIVQNDKKFIALYVLLLIGCVIGAIYMPNLFQFWISIAVIVGVAGYNHIRSKIKRQFTQQFGASIGFSYVASAGMESVSGRLFKFGHSQAIYDVLSGRMNDRDSRIYSYRFTIGSGRNSHTYNFTVFESTFANMMPDIMLTAKTSMFAAESLPGGVFMFDKDEHVEMEGDFNKYFTVRVPKGFETEAYQILPPDVMTDLIDQASGLNFEFNGNKLYIYAAKLVTVRGELQRMFDLAEYLSGLFSRSTRAVNVPPAVAGQ